MNSKKERIFIYRIYFPESNKCYIGQTNNIKVRMIVHLNGREGENISVHSALQKYDDWEISVLHTCYSRDEANRVEIEEIRNFNSVAPNGYNLTHGGEGGDTFSANPNKEAVRAKISAAGKEIGRKQRIRTVNSMIGRSFGKFYVVEYAPEISTGKRDYYHCICVCGNKRDISGRNLRGGNSKSCGCSSRITNKINYFKKLVIQIRKLESQQ